MEAQIESDRSPLVIEVSHEIFSRLHKARDVLTQATETLQETTQQAKASVTQTAQKAVNQVSTLTQQTQDHVTTSQNAVDRVTHDTIKIITATAQQAKASLQESLEQRLQAAEQIKSTTSETIQSAINTSVSNWLQANPTVLRLVQLLDWASHHPIVSIAILLLAIALTWSLIKSIGRLFESFWLLLLQVPLKLGQFFIRGCSQLVGKLSSSITERWLGNKNLETLVLQSSNSELPYQDKQRLLEISIRLEALRKEQNELLQEAVTILNLDENASDIFKDVPIQPIPLDINDNSLERQESKMSG